jgi:hypothetical protein
LPYAAKMPPTIRLSMALILKLDALMALLVLSTSQKEIQAESSCTSLEELRAGRQMLDRPFSPATKGARFTSAAVSTGRRPTSSEESSRMTQAKTYLPTGPKLFFSTAMELSIKATPNPLSNIRTHLSISEEQPSPDHISSTWTPTSPSKLLTRSY